MALTPLCDFAPMYLHPYGMVRRIRWENNDAGKPAWDRVLDRVCELAAAMQTLHKKKGAAPVSRDWLCAGLKAMGHALRQIAALGDAMGLEPAVMAHELPQLLAGAHGLATPF